jgi:hypothetical protein
MFLEKAVNSVGFIIKAKHWKAKESNKTANWAILDN